MPDAPPARLLDLSRLVSRIGRGPLTGIDRVELAYLQRLLDGQEPCFGLVRTALGLLLLDRSGMDVVRGRLSGAVPVGNADLLSRLTQHQPERARAETDVRRMALASAPGALGAGMLRRKLPQGTAYLNVGHANLSAGLMGTIRRALNGRIGVLVHDTIPLDHPEFSRAGVPEIFARKMKATSDAADLVIFTTSDARQRAEVHLSRMGRIPPAVVASLGVDTVAPDPLAIPADLISDRPFFLTLGTIEPRKNHGFLLDLWEEMHATRPEADIPRLIIAGVRGWSNHAVFRRLDTLPFTGRTVVECPDLTDRAVAALLQSAKALLFPTLAEGFGLPGVEAASTGCPVFCNELSVFRELLEDYPVYLPDGDRYAWLDAMTTSLTTGRQAGSARQARAAPRWDTHFNTVLSVI